ncbi:MAG TPA: sterol desaturase family protein [Alphaproteobacteria bacterium]|nr:sterol desaturase family protein [Alphaproteobacteria bacterium]
MMQLLGVLAPIFPILITLALFGAGIILERLAPAEKDQPERNKVLNIGYAVLVGVMSAALSPALAIASTSIVNGLGAGLIALPSSGWRLALSVIIYLLTVDFLEFAFHRAQHGVPLLWAMHSLHHSDPSVNVTTTTRNFWLELPIKAIGVYPLAAILFKVPQAVLFIYSLSTVWHYVNHLNCRWQLPVPWWILNNSQFHRIHHSVLIEHRDKNFSAYFPIWDVIFGTAVAPTRGSYPQTGLDTGEAPAGLATALVWPWRHFTRKSEAQL